MFWNVDDIQSPYFEILLSLTSETLEWLDWSLPLLVVFVANYRRHLNINYKILILLIYP